jgi:hypothetical protein
LDFPVNEFDPTITADDLHEFVKSQDDFGLELFVYGAARELGYEAAHGGSYIDKATNKRRQFDVQASIVIDSSTDPCITAPFQVSLALECKCLKPTFPLLVSRIPRLASESFHDRIVAANTSHETHYATGTSVRFGLATTETVRGIKSLYVPNAYVGKSTAQVGKFLPTTKKGESPRVEFKSNDMEVFEKWGQALGSANEFVQSIARSAISSDLRCIVLPVLVVSNDTLWAADYSENGSLQGPPKLVSEVEMFVGERYEMPGQHEFAISHMHIMTKDQVVQFMTKIANDIPYRRRLAELPQKADSRSKTIGYS